MDNTMLDRDDRFIKRISRKSFILSAFLHLLLLIALIRFTFSQYDTKTSVPHYYTPAYVYSGAVAPSSAQQVRHRQTPHTPSDNTAQPSPHGILKRSVLDMSRDVLANDQMQHQLHMMKNEEPMLLIGDQSQMADPLIKLIGISLSAHFSYPKVEGNLGLRGKVIVEMTLHPEGYYSDVRIIRSSDNPDFDSAALYAVNSAPKVKGADFFIQQPKYLVVGFIFD